MIKRVYSQPTSKLLVVRFEVNFMSKTETDQGGSFGGSGSADTDDLSGDTDWWS